MFTKKALFKTAFVFVTFVVLAWLMFSWSEAKSEVEVLCSNFHPGTSEQEVLRTLETGDYLRYEELLVNGTKTLKVYSVYNLGSSACVVEFARGGGVFQAYVE